MRFADRARGLALLPVLALLVGCASAGVTNRQSFVPDSEIQRPSLVVVHDFAISAGDVVVDTFGPQFAGSEGDVEQRSQLARDAQEHLAGAIVAKLRERGIPADRASGAPVPLNALVLKGQFLTVSEGDQLKRMTIGFGAGASEIRIRAQVFQARPSGLVRLREAEAVSSGSKMPGMAAPVGVGAAAGRAATSAIVSGGLNVVREVRGSVGADLDRMAEEIADRAKTYYESRGWL